MPDQLKRQKSYPACGRLIVLQSLGQRSLLNFVSQEENRGGFSAINFPAMPDAIDLVRKADYMVSTPIGFPDGIHMYKGTSVLKIPVSFRLHSFDEEFCPRGVKSLLQIAAELQALTLPFGNSHVPVTTGTEAEKGKQKLGDDNTKGQTSAEPTKTWYNPANDIYPPATCYLELIITERDSYGICCVGYVEEVRVKLSGPFMRGPGMSQNLPTHGDFEFTFVHHPGHTNSWSANKENPNMTEQQAYAQEVRDKLYNTVHLMTNPQDFRSFNDYKPN